MSYPKVFALGHRYVNELLFDPVLVEEKIDGSQINFSKNNGELSIRSKSSDATPHKMFKVGVEAIEAIADKLQEGLIYHGEYLEKPKHNVIAYERIPHNHIMIFDISSSGENYLDYESKVRESERLGFEVVPKLYYGKLTDLDFFKFLLEEDSILGNSKIEGVVIKNYERFGIDKKVLMGKYVSEAFKEKHQKEWRGGATKADLITQMIQHLKTEARWHKAVQHLRDSGILQDAPQDIGNLIKEIQRDILEEETDWIKNKLFKETIDRILRGVAGGVAEWYKQQLLEKQFDIESSI